MTIETIPGSDLRYYLLGYDKNGKERDNDPDAPTGRLSEVVKDVLKEQPVTDVFLMSHGWKGDVPAAKEQFDEWTAAMLGCTDDRSRMRELRPDFEPLIIGLHWPSLPWGDEALTAEAAFGSDESPIQDWIDDAADKLADTERARGALATIFASALDDMAPPELPVEVVEAYKILGEEAGLGADGVGAAPGADIDLFDPEVIYQQALEEESAFGGFPGVGGVLSVLRQLSFWTMKARARTFGESGGADLLRALQTIAAQVTAGDPARGDIRFHLMGHSFGCIVVSATVAGAGGDAPLTKPVDSMYLVQGALSLWTYCNDIPVEKGTPGYFSAIVGRHKVSGPIVTTQSEHDTAVRRLYPLGARIKRQVDMAPGELPKYGGLGTFGAQGPGLVIEDLDMLPLTEDYGFAGGRVYNLDGSNVINAGEGVSGAHSDIAKPEVGHAFWQAAMVTVRRATSPVSFAAGLGGEEGMAMGDGEHLAFNGINGATGDYLLPAMTPAEISKIAQGEPLDEAFLKELKWRYAESTTAKLGLEEGRDPKDLSSAGWGIVFAFEDGRADQIREALGPLLALRRQQAGGLYREFTGVASVRPGESKNKWLARHGTGPGPVDPTRVPYYLLLVGDPERIPYRFQYQLGVQFAVGRIHFDSIAEYDHYARSVVAAETGGLALPRRAVFFGVHNQGDVATSQSAQQLVAPLAEQMAADQPDWTVETLLKADATKARLSALLGGADTPAFLFTASHGMGFPKDDPRQLPHQGALLCQDWPGPLKWQGAIPEDHYFSAHDVGDDARLHGLMTFHFACYGAGTPLLDDFAHQAFKDRVDIAPRPFIARLPQRLIAHPQGGALAAVGHVERAWTYSFRWRRAGAQTTVFKATLKRLMEGHPVGSALEFFPERYAELSTMLSADLEDIKFGAEADDLELAGLWTANNDARSYVIIGDPAVRLPVAATSAATTARDAVDLRSVGPAAAPAATAAPSGQAPAAGFGIGAAAPAGGAHPGALTVTTAVAADMDDPASRQIAARTRISPAGDVETVVAADQAGNEDLLELHRWMVDGALEARLRSPRSGEAGET